MPDVQTPVCLLTICSATTGVAATSTPCASHPSRAHPLPHHPPSVASRYWTRQLCFPRILAASTRLIFTLLFSIHAKRIEIFSYFTNKQKNEQSYTYTVRDAQKTTTHRGFCFPNRIRVGLCIARNICNDRLD